MPTKQSTRLCENESLVMLVDEQGRLNCAFERLGQRSYDELQESRAFLSSRIAQIENEQARSINALVSNINAFIPRDIHAN